MADLVGNKYTVKYYEVDKKNQNILLVLKQFFNFTNH